MYKKTGLLIYLVLMFAMVLISVPCGAASEATYTYSLAPTSGPDTGKTVVPLKSGALSGRNDSITVWNNGQNELVGKTISITFDLGSLQPVSKLKARSIVPTWSNFSNATFSISSDNASWTTIASKPGFPDFERDGGKIRIWEFEPEMQTSLARYIRYDIVPSGWVHPTLSDIIIIIEDTPLVAQARKSALSVVHGFYKPDVLPPNSLNGYFYEKWRDGNPLFPADAGPGGFIKVHLYNDSDNPWLVDSITLNAKNNVSVKVQDAIIKHSNTKEGALNENEIFYSSTHFGLTTGSPEAERLTAVGDPVWFNIEPNPVPAHSRAEVTVRCRLDPKSLSSVTVAGSGKSADFTPTDAFNGLKMKSYSFSYDMRRLYIYVERISESVKPVEVILLDGKDVREGMFAMQSSWNPGGVAGYIVKLPEPLKFGSFHTLTVISGDGKVDTAQIRARDAFFPICMFGPPVEEEVFLKDLARNYFNSVAWCDLAADKAIQYGLRTFSGEVGNPAVYGSFIQDEPDCVDYSCPELDGWQKLGTSGLFCAQKRQSMLAANPTALQMLNMDSTYKPLNWMCYAQLGDIIAHDPYYAGNVKDGKDPMMVYADMKILGDNAQPKPTFTLLYACADKNFGFQRFITFEELELQNAYALAAGVKGISYWWYRDAPTVANNPALMRAMGRVNARVRQVSEFAANGIATDWAKAELKGTPKQHPIASGPVRVWCKTVWSPDGMIVFVCNNEYISNEKGFTYKPIKNVPVVVTMPDAWQKKVTIYEVSDTGTSEPRTLEVKNGQVRFNIDSVKVSRWYVIKP